MDKFINADELATVLQGWLVENEKHKATAGYQSVVTFVEILDICEAADVVPRAELERSLKEIRALSAFKDYFLDLYGKGLEITNWHLNGNTEPFDSFYNSALEEYAAALQ